TWDKGMKLYSVPDAIAKSLELMAGIVNPATAASILKDVKVTSELETGKQASITEKGVTEGAIIKPDKCPSCQEDTLVNENGCFTCMSCSYTKCE
ncbi:MAG: hypothetical protein KGH64_03405, partial [Candidatus Micrarchaeota archaeon]|nr:hypothetical protein [Candidatus Micrarchaeota archaeon]